MDEMATHDRNEAIWLRRQSGETYTQIARAAGLSAGRVRHICNRMAHRSGVERKPEKVAMSAGSPRPQGPGHTIRALRSDGATLPANVAKASQTDTQDGH